VNTSRTTVIAIPVYNDWLALSILLKDIDNTLASYSSKVHVIIIDDASTQSGDPINSGLTDPKCVKRIDVIRMARNLGHQKAIALGLAYIHDSVSCDQIIVMDCDGEDQPTDIVRLMDEAEKNPNFIVFAKRSKRSEGRVFKIFYALYRMFFRLLTGKQISFGNFSLIPASLLTGVVYLPEIWNHFAAGVMRSSLPCKTIATCRATRYAGKSRMNFTSLLIHGLSAISVYVEVLTVRLMVLTFALILLGVAGFGMVLYIKYFTPLAIPGWATTVGIGLAVIMFQAVLFLTLLSFVILSHRSNKLFIPAKDYKDYLVRLERVPLAYEQPDLHWERTHALR
jgi:polyisoprenyl-phosphate glycosyltransferase